MTDSPKHTEIFTVQLRDDNAIFYRRNPVTLSLTQKTLHLSEHTLPLRTFTVQKGLGRNELVITARRTVLTIRPTVSDDPHWPRLTALLTAPTNPSSPTTPAPHYTFHEELGRGAFGVVNLATAPDGTTVAVKRVCKKRLHGSAAALAAARREVAVANRLPSHENIVRILDARETPSDFLIVMEHIPAGTLLNYVQTRRPPPYVIANIIRQVLAAVAHVHQHGLVHRDVKLENLLVVDADAELPIVKLCDFGLAIYERAIDTRRSSPGSVGTGYAQAPEMVLREVQRDEETGYGRAVDVWACGIVLFSMLHRRFPWLDDNKERREQMLRMMALSRVAEPSIEVIQTASEARRNPPFLQSLLCGLLQPEAKRRLTARAALEHRLFTMVAYELQLPLSQRNKPLDNRDSGSPRSLRQAATSVLSILRMSESLQTRKEGGEESRLLWW